MSRIKTLALASAAATTAALALAAPASAWTGGPITATLSQPLTIESSIGGGTCTTSTLGGSVTPAGALTVNSASITGCSGDFPITVTTQNLPWGGNLGGTTASITGFRVSAAITVPIFGNITCIYGGNLSGSLSGSAPSVTATFDTSVSKVNSGSHFFCPGTADITGQYTITGSGL
ncbi:hypothetical protein [Actinocorallia populi]|uniref:hypothetical protein n=1 Tax=Actinocorallia populi TaxID=2079200 RepID=UPI000D08F6AC|nr:hypothetical protein [Actinocorallia populi]